MRVVWEEHRWPRFVHGLLRMLRQPAADQAALRVQVEEPQALGRMILENAAGQTLYALIDCTSSRQKWFYLPARVVEEGLVLKRETGEILFSLGAGVQDTGNPAAPDREPDAASAAEASADAASVESDADAASADGNPAAPGETAAEADNAASVESREKAASAESDDGAAGAPASEAG